MTSERKDQILRIVSGVIEKLRRQLDAGLDRQATEFDLLPIDLNAIATSLGLKIITRERLDGSTPTGSETSGAIYRKRKEILIAAGDKHTRQQFTKAHELGHYLLHDQLENFREVLASSDRGNKPTIEQDADFFAAELLMPVQLVKRIFLQYFGGSIDGTVPNDDIAFFLSQVPHRKFSASEIVKMGKDERAKLFARIGTYAGVHFNPMCEVFDVSVEAMANRLKDLGLVK
jgi:Zn-dependent peptidase ImmA (M78 family)